MSKRISSIVTIVIGVVGIAYGCINAFVKSPGHLPVIGGLLGRPPAITVFLLGAILVVVGVQNLAVLLGLSELLSKVDKTASHILRVVTVNPDPVILDGEKEIYDKAAVMVSQATRIIRAATFRNSHAVDTPPYWSSLVEHLLAASAGNSPVDYRLVYGYGSRDNVRAALAAHRSFFQRSGVAGSFHPKFLSNAVGVDLLIVDHTSFMIALPVLSSDRSVRRAMLISDADSLILDVAEWFDNYLWAKANTSIR
jgi:hypothetical protein